MEISLKPKGMDLGVGWVVKGGGGCGGGGRSCAKGVQRGVGGHDGSKGDGGRLFQLERHGGGFRCGVEARVRLSETATEIVPVQPHCSKARAFRVSVRVVCFV